MDGDNDFFGMSDEDFAKASPSPVTDEGASASSKVSGDEGKNEPENEDLPDATSGDEPDPSGSDDDDAAELTDAEKAAAAEDADEDDETLKNKPAPVADPKPDTPAGKAGGKDKAAGAEDPAGKADPKTPAPDAAPVERKPEEYRAFFDSLIGKPIKANGREIILKTPEEVQRLVQMGAGYGRKLQEIQPHLKTLRMLEKSNLLGEADLSYLIDLHQKNPAAIKKLIKDSGIDPLDLNMDDNADYRPSNHSVSDNEVAFAETLKEVAALPGGRETIQHINTQWDQASKTFLWANPAVLATIQSQRENGLYAQITDEMERQKTLGDIKPGTPFLEAYKMAGDALVATNSLNLPGSEVTTPTPTPPPQTTRQGRTDQPGRVLATRTASPRSGAQNNERARAASSPTNSSRKAKETQNPLDMADDVFLKTFADRL